MSGTIILHMACDRVQMIVSLMDTFIIVGVHKQDPLIVMDSFVNLLIVVTE